MRLILCDRCKKEIKGNEVGTIYLNGMYRVMDQKAELCPECFHNILKDINLTKIDIADVSIEDLNLTVRASKCLQLAEINTIGELAKLSKQDLGKMRNLGAKAYREIIEKMEDYGIKLKDKNEDKS